MLRNFRVHRSRATKTLIGKNSNTINILIIIIEEKMQHTKSLKQLDFENSIKQSF